MRIYVNIDRTICVSDGSKFDYAIPYRNNIERINKAFDEGNEIIYWCERGDKYHEITKRQLANWGVKYTTFLVGTPIPDLFINDKNINKIDEKLTEWLTAKKE